MQHSKKLCAAIGLGALLCTSAQAATDADPQRPADWWNHSSMYRNIEPGTEWLTRGRLSASYMDLGGNDEGRVYFLDGTFQARYQQTTATLSAHMSRQNVERSDGSSVNKDYKLVIGSLTHDLHPMLFAEAGMLWERDLTSFVSWRTIPYLGAGSYLIDNQRHQLRILLAYGYQNLEYEPEIEQYLGLTEENLGVLYFFQTYRLNITPKLSFNQSFRLIQNMDETPGFDDNYAPEGTDDRSRWRFVTGLDYQFNRIFSIGLQNQVDMDSQPLPTVLERDRTTKMTFNLQF